MKQLDSTYYSFTCPICEKHTEVCNKVYVCDFLTDCVPICSSCADGLKVLVKNCPKEKQKTVLSAMLNIQVEFIDSITQFNPAHQKINSKLDKVKETYTFLCDCCGRPMFSREDQLMNTMNKECIDLATKIHGKRKAISKLFKSVKLPKSICICDNCLSVIELIATKAKSPEQFIWFIDKSFKYSPFNQN